MVELKSLSILRYRHNKPNTHNYCICVCVLGVCGETIASYNVIVLAKISIKINGRRNVLLWVVIFLNFYEKCIYIINHYYHNYSFVY